MTHYSQHELDAKIQSFMKKKMHQFPQLRNERHYIERTDSIRPIEKHRTTTRSQVYAGARLGFAA